MWQTKAEILTIKQLQQEAIEADPKNEDNSTEAVVRPASELSMTLSSRPPCKLRRQVKSESNHDSSTAVRAAKKPVTPRAVRGSAARTHRKSDQSSGVHAEVSPPVAHSGEPNGPRENIRGSQ